MRRKNLKEHTENVHGKGMPITEKKMQAVAGHVSVGDMARADQEGGLPPGD